MEHTIDHGSNIMRSFAVAAALLLSGIAVSATTSDPYESVNASWDRFGAVYGHVLGHYYERVDNDELMRSVIDGLLRNLDSYSQFFDEEGLRQLRQDTTGRFAGLGITVGTKDNYPVVIAPIEDTPAHRAGLQPGDLIVAVDGTDTFGLSLEEVVTILRGEPGSSVRVTIARVGKVSNWDVELVREIITITTVSVADMVAPGVGYIGMRQTRFSEDTAAEVTRALRELKDRGAERLILDLRGNPGGLLTQATHVADLFLRKGTPIVSIRERDGRREQMRYSQEDEIVSDPVVVLVDGGSASAAEIVAGAIQDNDRGLVVGTESFGKGSVQTIFNLGDPERGALKLTTALYYTPSGRSIHRPALGSQSGLLAGVDVGGIEVPAAVLLGIIMRATSEQEAADELRARFDLDPAAVDAVLATPLADLAGSTPSPTAPDSAESTFRTTNGREVFGGGGISPDIYVEAEAPPEALAQLLHGRVFFDFVIDYIGTEMAVADSSVTVAVDDSMIAAFHAFIPRIDKPFSQPNSGLDQVETLRELAAQGGWQDDVATLLDSVESVAAMHETSLLPPRTERYIRRSLQRELALRLKGKRASLLASLEGDPQMQAAIDLLSDTNRYRQLLGQH